MHEDAEAGYFDDVFQEGLNYLLSQLPDGYTIDDESRVVRLDPDLSDHVYITSMVLGVPSGRVRVPVYTGQTGVVSCDRRVVEHDQDHVPQGAAGPGEADQIGWISLLGSACQAVLSTKALGHFAIQVPSVSSEFTSSTGHRPRKYPGRARIPLPIPRRCPVSPSGRPRYPG